MRAQICFVHVSKWIAVRLSMAAASVALLAGAAAAQTIEYTVTDLPPQAPGAWNTVPLAINDQGAVVGWAQFSGGEFYMRGWRWSAAEGMTLLPAPPGAMSNRYAATDINNGGVIAGDGGYDSGQVWRFEDGAYTIVGSLPGLLGSRGPGINSFGDIVATAFDPQSFLTPTRALLFTGEKGTVELFPQYGRSAVGDLNDAGQISASTTAGPVRVESDGSLTFLPVPPGFASFLPGPINAAGDIAGIAACSHECNQAALWTEATGYQIIPWVGTRHSVGGLNDRQEVVGGVEEGVQYAWIWSPDRGLRLLASLIDPDLTRNVVRAMDVNNAGQIITYGYDYSDSLDPFRIMLLTPINPPIPADFDGDGDVDLDDFGLFAACYNGANNPPAPACPPGVDADLDGDGDVDLDDFAVFAANFTGAL